MKTTSTVVSTTWKDSWKYYIQQRRLSEVLNKQSSALDYTPSLLESPTQPPISKKTKIEWLERCSTLDRSPTTVLHVGRVVCCRTWLPQLLPSTGLICCCIFDHLRSKEGLLRESVFLVTRLSATIHHNIPCRVKYLYWIPKANLQIVDKIIPSKFVLFLKDFRSFNIVRVFYVRGPDHSSIAPFHLCKAAYSGPHPLQRSLHSISVVCCLLYRGRLISWDSHQS